MLYRLNLFFILVRSTNGDFNTKNSTYITVNTDKGQVRGYDFDLGSGEHLHVYLGIPYAEAPLGKLRFLPTYPKKPWFPNIWNATFFRPVCPQATNEYRLYDGYKRPHIAYHNGKHFNNMDEDCLHLNLYVPKRSSDFDRSYPVMVFIHGGSFEFGSGLEYDGRILAAKGDVVVVTFNYRLGILGFLSTEDFYLRGNQGLLDQVEALKWVKRNIRQFGGDPGRVTIFGQSAGGSSTALHMFSRLSKGLFHGVISQSGNALAIYAMDRPPFIHKNTTKMVAHQMNCTTSSTEKLVKCLQQQSVHDLINKTYVWMVANTLFTPYSPCVDGIFIHDLPENLLQSGNFNKDIRVMTGYLTDEAARMIALSEDSIFYNNYWLYSLLLLKVSRPYFYHEEVKTILKHHYPESSSNTTAVRDTMIRLKTDYLFAIPSIRQAQMLTERGVKSWLYEFSFRSPNDPEPIWMGAWHGVDLLYIFGTPMFSDVPVPGNDDVYWSAVWEHTFNWTKSDQIFSEKMIKIWSDFAKMNSTDTSLMLAPNISWNPFTNKDREFLEIGKVFEVKQDPRQDVIQFWDRFDYLRFNDKPEICKIKPLQCSRKPPPFIVG